MKLLLPILLLFVFTFSSQAQNSPCGQHEVFTKLDFWVGNWTVYSPNGQVAGHNKISKILDGCTILEEWTGSGPSRGKSLNFYNPQSKMWKQVWVDNFGNPLIFDGTVKQDSMIYIGTSLAANGAQVTNKMTLSKVTDDEVRQLWEQSTDEGTSWNTVFDGKYVRDN